MANEVSPAAIPARRPHDSTVPRHAPERLSAPLAYLTLATLAACGSTPQSQPTAAPEATASTAPAPIKIGIALGGGAMCQ